ncbi:MAG TPA: zinc metalloprotease HtpX [Candidatus Vogelbacteria bacterium]|nr:zinc metalloprotease HtpX [Candidatus Vogelbacteria bacterium]
MATLYTQQDRNIRRTWLLFTVFFMVVVALGWFFSFLLNEALFLYLALAFALVMNIVSFWYSDKIVLKMSRAEPADEKTYRDLHNIVENLAITAGLPKPKVYTINDPSPNAFATGRNKDKAVVAVTTGLLNLLNRSELEGVIAHELAHIGNRDILLATVAAVLVGFVVILSDMFLRLSLFRGRSSSKGGGVQVVLVLIGFLLAMLAPLFATLIQLAISRRREFLADASGALLTRYPEGLANALEKISANNRPLATASQATAHMYIANPFGNKSSNNSKWRKLFMTHPPVEERIKALGNR